jgi:hypothetical protein
MEQVQHDPKHVARHTLGLEPNDESQQGSELAASLLILAASLLILVVLTTRLCR